MKTTIIPEKIDFYSKDKDGKEYISKFNKPYIKAKLTAGGKSIYINIFNPEQKALLMVGKALDLEVEQNGQYTNYSIPKEKTENEKEIGDLKKRVGVLENIILAGNDPEIGGHVNDRLPQIDVDDDIKESDLPF